MLTKFFLKMPYEATGAFRLYRLNRISRAFLDLIQSNGYSFFFEILYVLHLNKYRIVEIAIDLPARVYGHSKKSLKDDWHSVMLLAHIYFTTLLNRERYEIADPIRSRSNESQG